MVKENRDGGQGRDKKRPEGISSLFSSSFGNEQRNDPMRIRMIFLTLASCFTVKNQTPSFPILPGNLSFRLKYLPFLLSHQP